MNPEKQTAPGWGAGRGQDDSVSSRSNYSPLDVIGKWLKVAIVDLAAREAIPPDVAQRLIGRLNLKNT